MLPFVFILWMGGWLCLYGAQRSEEKRNIKTIT
jgi:hypothetical protein